MVRETSASRFSTSASTESPSATSEDFDLARLAAETAYTAAPDDETSRLDLIDVAAETGHADLADRQLVDGIRNRTDDELGPINLPNRTATILRQRVGRPRPDRAQSKGGTVQAERPPHKQCRVA